MENNTHYFRVSKIKNVALRRAAILASLPVLMAGNVLLSAFSLARFLFWSSNTGLFSSAISQWKRKP